ncbi:hypothetical protein M0R45_037059 [Rubus argutus]|uniref:Uncharacterized protein n=1 Tax=Rubus argutus TaxID=59490 RepID=A0AAW1W1T6_RUBAR
MASLEEPALVVADTKEEKNKKREARNKTIEEEKRRKKEEEHQNETELLRMQVDLHRNKDHHNIKQQLSRDPATHVPPVASAKSHTNYRSQSQALKALVKANVTRVPAAWDKAAPIINGHLQFQASNAPAETPIPTASAMPISSTTAISHHKQQPTSTAGSTDMAFFVGQILQVQEVNAMTYASALQKRKAAEAQNPRQQANNNNVTTIPVQKENSAPHTKTTDHVSMGVATIE